MSTDRRCRDARCCCPWLLLPHHDLHRPFRLQRHGGPLGLFLAERGGDVCSLLLWFIRVAGALDPDRCRYGDRALRRHRDDRASVSSHTLAPRPAVVLGLLPGLAGWGAQLLKAGLRTGGLGTPERPFNQQMVQQLASGDVWAAGAFALEQGQIITAMLLAACSCFRLKVDSSPLQPAVE